MTETPGGALDNGSTTVAGRVPLLHYTPSSGWMNDPNGLIDRDGRHHLFFQHNPDDIRQQRIRWGHASSTDLVRWTTHRDVLLAGVPDTSYDRDGCFSGCAVADGDGVTLIYTGVEGSMELPCLATSNSPGLEQFTKSAGNPVIARRPIDDVVAFRDHSVFRDVDVWRHAVGGGTRSLGGAVFGYVGDSLAEWRFDQLVLDSTRSSIPGTVWECPDLFRLDGDDVLIVSPLDATRSFVRALPEVWYTIGELVGGRFEPRHAEMLDYGDRLYAPQSYWTADGRRIMFGWIRTDQDPAVAAHPTRGAMSLPRELLSSNGYLYQRPAREIVATRDRTPISTFHPHQRDCSITIEPPTTAVEIMISGGVPDITSIELIDTQRRRLRVHVDRIPADAAAPGGQCTILYFDAGIVETFRDGRAAATTDLGFGQLVDIVVHRSTRCTAETIAVWALGG